MNDEEQDEWWIDETEKLETGYGTMVAIRDANRLVVGFMRPEDAQRVAKP